jgi:hypothetical protein
LPRPAVELGEYERYGAQPSLLPASRKRIGHNPLACRHFCCVYATKRRVFTTCCIYATNAPRWGVGWVESLSPRRPGNRALPHADKKSPMRLNQMERAEIKWQA